MICDEKELGLLVYQAVSLLKKTRCLLLSGPVGVGKTAFARSVIRILCSDAKDIPSPSFPLMLPYDTHLGRLWHVDLYRLSDAECRKECEAMGLFDCMKSDYVILEWPERLPSMLSGAVIRFDFTSDEKTRQVVFPSVR